jgi:hypothetical protein
MAFFSTVSTRSPRLSHARARCVGAPPHEDIASAGPGKQNADLRAQTSGIVLFFFDVHGIERKHSEMMAKQGRNTRLGANRNGFLEVEVAGESCVAQRFASSINGQQGEINRAVGQP